MCGRDIKLQLDLVRNRHTRREEGDKGLPCHPPTYKSLCAQLLDMC